MWAEEDCRAKGEHRFCRVQVKRLPAGMALLGIVEYSRVGIIGARGVLGAYGGVVRSTMGVEVKCSQSEAVWG